MFVFLTTTSIIVALFSFLILRKFNKERRDIAILVTLSLAITFIYTFCIGSFTMVSTRDITYIDEPIKKIEINDKKEEVKVLTTRGTYYPDYVYTGMDNKDIDPKETYYLAVPKDKKLRAFTKNNMTYNQGTSITLEIKTNHKHKATKGNKRVYDFTKNNM